MQLFEVIRYPVLLWDEMDFLFLCIECTLLMIEIDFHLPMYVKKRRFDRNEHGPDWSGFVIH